MSEQRYSAQNHVIFGLICLGILVAGLGVWGTTARLAGAVIASGVVEVESNRQVIEHSEGGIVSSIAVKDGDLVHAGDTLIVLDDLRLSSEVKRLEAQLFQLGRASRQAEIRS